MKYLKRALIALLLVVPMVSFGATKALVTNVVGVYSSNIFRVIATYYDGNIMIGETNGIEVSINGIDGSLQSIRDAIQSAVVSDAYASWALTITADDVILSWPPTGLAESKAMAGILSALIDGKTVGNTTVFTNNTGMDFWVSDYAIMPQTITGLGTAPVINLGKTASAYSDIDSGVSLAIATNSGKISWETPGNNAVRVANGESLVVRVATAAILTTTFTFKVLVRGNYTN